MDVGLAGACGPAARLPPDQPPVSPASDSYLRFSLHASSQRTLIQYNRGFSRGRHPGRNFPASSDIPSGSLPVIDMPDDSCACDESHCAQLCQTDCSLLDAPPTGYLECVTNDRGRTTWRRPSRSRTKCRTAPGPWGRVSGTEHGLRRRIQECRTHGRRRRGREPFSAGYRAVHVLRTPNKTCVAALLRESSRCQEE